MRHLSEFTSAPQDLFHTGQELSANLYIYLPQNKNILFFRRLGDLLTEEDCEKIRMLPKGTLLVLRSEQRQLYAPLSGQLASQINSGYLRAPEVKVGAAVLLTSVMASPMDSEEASGDYARQCLMMVPQLVEELMAKVTKTPSIQSYETTVQKLKTFKQDAIFHHNEQVSAIAILMCLTLGCNSPDELATVGTAAFLHDLGLRHISKPIAEKHLTGIEELTSSEKIAYMAHVYKSLEEIQKSGIKVSEAVIRAVGNHHENFDGTGFNAVAGKDIDLPARIIRIADDIVSCISHPKNAFGFREAHGYLATQERTFENPVYDPVIMEALAALE